MILFFPSFSISPWRRHQNIVLKQKKLQSRFCKQIGTRSKLPDNYKDKCAACQFSSEENENITAFSRARRAAEMRLFLHEITRKARKNDAPIGKKALFTAENAQKCEYCRELFNNSVDISITRWYNLITLVNS